MIVEEVDISKIKPSKYNPRTISEFDYNNLVQNIKKFGFVEPLVVNANYDIIGGHQRFKALKELNYKSVKVVKVDLSKEEEKLLNISLNKISGEWDFDKLKEILNEYDDKDLKFTGFGDIELSNIKIDFDDIDKLRVSLEKSEEEYAEWNAKIKKDKIEYIRKVISKIQGQNKISKNFKSEQFNGKVLEFLCKHYEKHLSDRTKL